MTGVEGVAVVLAGVGAGVINTVVGSGTLLTFPILLWTGLPPVAANVANNIGLAPGSVSGAVGYRQELSGPKDASSASPWPPLRAAPAGRFC